MSSSSKNQESCETWILFCGFLPFQSFQYGDTLPLSTDIHFDETMCLQANLKKNTQTLKCLRYVATTDFTILVWSEH